MASLKLLADDLTGALDTAAEFVGLFGPLPVVWPATSLAQDAPSFVIDSGTRELGGEEAFVLVGEFARRLAAAVIASRRVVAGWRAPWPPGLEPGFPPGAGVA